LNIDLSVSFDKFGFKQHTHAPKRRDDAHLSFLPQVHLPEQVLYDTTVYIDALQGKLSEQLKQIIATNNPWHSTVAESELIYLCGRLDPTHPKTSLVMTEIMGHIDRWHTERVLNPDREVWREAAILTGIVSRLHALKTEDRGRMMNDALIFLTALKHGCTVLTRNIKDFDLLLQLVPAGRVVFYRQG